MPRQPDQAGLLICQAGFNFDHGARQVYVHPGAIVRAGCWVVRGHERWFSPLILVAEDFGGDPQSQARVAVAVVSLGADESFTHVPIRIAGHVDTAETAFSLGG